MYSEELVTHDLGDLSKLTWVGWEILCGPIRQKLDNLLLEKVWNYLVDQIRCPSPCPKHIAERMWVLITSLRYGFSVAFDDLPKQISNIDFVVKRVIQYRLGEGK